MRLIFFVTLLAITLVGNNCGGGGSNSNPTSPTINSETSGCTQVNASFSTAISISANASDNVEICADATAYYTFSLNISDNSFQYYNITLTDLAENLDLSMYNSTEDIITSSTWPGTSDETIDFCVRTDGGEPCTLNGVFISTLHNVTGNFSFFIRVDNNSSNDTNYTLKTSPLTSGIGG